ncbi:non-ribosomal peptide synthetase [Rhodovulum sulfidophilum]|uniref:Non-ribosomal peptide synthetase n=1 Tax=Rhodovulum sulfidophilum TaxID=35806 RepID=A0A0D6AYT8_RHOSU|nr:non-ribosomal peptide synthetase [Rhodovulum sulfidophilum]
MEDLTYRNGLFAQTLLGDLLEHARINGGKTAFSFYSGPGASEATLDFAGLEQSVARMTAALSRRRFQGRPVMLVYPAGIEFAVSFLAAMAAGCIAVPCPAGDWTTRKRSLPRLLHIAGDCMPAAAIGPAKTLGGLDFGQTVPHILAHEDLMAEDPGDFSLADAAAALDPHADAYLQYSSGSTLRPKAVRLTHANLQACNRTTAEVLDYGPDSIVVSWMPHYHDYALTQGVALPIALGASCHFMAPGTFLRRPMLWLQLISQTRATHAGGPNFSWAYTAERLRPGEEDGLDLSSWTCGHSAAEPIRREVVERFLETFAPCGLRPETMRSAYGMAETVAVVTSGRLAGPRAFQRIPELNGRGPEFANCGRSDAQMTLLIVDPETRHALPEGKVGEIWIRHDSVAKGYQGHARGVEDTFRAETADGDGPFLRSSDLGFLDQGDLFVTGRLKDVIILNGENIWPQDIETVAQAADPALRSDGGTAFDVADDAGRTRIVLVQEVRAAKEDLPDIAARIRTALAGRMGLARLDEIVFIRSGAVEKTSSGKVMRSRMKTRWQVGDLEVLARDRLPETAGECGHEDVLAALGLGPKALESPASLTALGADSLRCATGAEALRRRYGLDMALSDLALTTGIELADLLRNRPQGDPGPAEPDAAAAAPQGPAAPTPLQRAYLAGRAAQGLDCALYLETGCPADLPHARLEDAWSRLVARHDALRMIVTPEDRIEILSQPPGSHEIPRIYLSSAAERRGIEAQMRRRTAPLAHWPLYGICRSTLPGEPTDRLHLCLDLIALDAPSILKLLLELGCLIRDPEAPLPPVEGKLAQSLAALAGNPVLRQDTPPLPELPVLPGAARPDFVHLERNLDPGIAEAFRQTAANWSVSPAVLLAAAYAEVCRRWSGGAAETTLNLTSVVPEPAPDGAIAPLADRTRTIWLKAAAGDGPDLRRRAQVLARRMLDRLERPGTDLGDLSGGVPLVLTSLLDAVPPRLSPLRRIEGLGPVLSRVSQTPHVWIDAQAFDDAEGMVLSWDYDRPRFPEGLAAAMFGAWAGLIQRLARDPDAAASAPLPLPEAQSLGRAAVNHRPMPEPQALLSDAVFAETRRRPGAAALICGEASVSFAGLSAEAGRIAGLLLARGLPPGGIVAIDLPRSPLQIACVLGVLAAGGVYLPCDPGWPEARIADILKNAGAFARLGRRPASAGDDGTIRIDPEAQDGARLQAAPSYTPHPRGPGDVAYLIYTSGSTGRPKGVAVSHRAALTTIGDICDRFGIGPGDRGMAISSLAFDLSVFDIFGCLGRGAALVLPPEGAQRDPQTLLALAETHRATIWNSVPAILQMAAEFADETDRALPRDLRLGLISGDWIPRDLPTRVAALAPGMRLMGLGGATEAAIWSNIFDTADTPCDWPSVPYGLPLRNQGYRVLDNTGLDCPDWVEGDLVITGGGLAEGYWNDPTRSAAAFSSDPQTGTRYYCTGDRARYRPGAVLEFLGRRDQQVKIGGFRVELGEIEAVLSGLDGVRRGIALLRGAGETASLVAAVLPDPSGPVPDPADLGAALSGRLPGYMLPRHIRLIETLPLSPNGKIDRKALAALFETGCPAEAAPGPRPPAPQTGASRAWALLAGLLPPGTPLHEDRPLIELGLSSLEIIRLATGLTARTGRPVNAADLARASGLGAIEAMLGGTAGPASPAPPADPIEAWCISQAGATLCDAAQREAFKAGHVLDLATATLPDLRFGARPLPAAFDRRYSCRSFRPEPVGDADLGVWLSAACLAIRGNRLAGQWGSAGASFPLELHLLRPGADGGWQWWRHDPARHGLSRGTAARTGPAGFSPMNGQWLAGAAGLLVCAADMARIAPLYGTDAPRMVWIECGAAMQALELSAAEAGIGCCQIGDVDRASATRSIGLADGCFALHALAFGQPEPGERSASASEIRPLTDSVEEGSL